MSKTLKIDWYEWPILVVGVVFLAVAWALARVLGCAIGGHVKDIEKSHRDIPYYGHTHDKCLVCNAILVNPLRS